VLEKKAHRERASLIVSIVAVVIALGSALFSLLQTRVSMRALAINEQLLELNYLPSVEVTYSDHRINTVNKGKTNLLIWGDRLSDQQPVMEKDPRLVTPGGSYYILAETFEREVMQKFPDGSDTFVPFEVYIQTENTKKYMVKAQLLVKMKSGVPEIHCQTLSISPWEG